MSKRKTLALDIDGVVFDCTPWMVEQLNKKFRTDYTPEDINDFEYSNLSTRERDYMFHLWDVTDYNYIQPVDGFYDALALLQEKCDVIAVSTPMDAPLHLKSKWNRLCRAFGRGNVYLCADKTRIKADCLVEDAPHNILAWAKLGKPVIIQRRPYNKELRYNMYDKTHEYYEWGEIEDITSLPEVVSKMMEHEIF